MSSVSNDESELNISSLSDFPEINIKEESETDLDTEQLQISDESLLSIGSNGDEMTNDVEDESFEYEADADQENTENEHNDSWIDADSVTNSLQHMNDHGSILNHLQSLYKTESAKSKQKERIRIRETNRQIRSFSLSPKHKLST
eukprot:378175_1